MSKDKDVSTTSSEILIFENFTPEQFIEVAWYLDARDIFKLANKSKKLENMCEKYTDMYLNETVFAKGNEVYCKLYNERFDKYMFMKLFYDRKLFCEDILDNFQYFCHQQDSDWLDDRYYECFCEGIRIINGDCHCDPDKTGRLRRGPYGIEGGKIPEMKINRKVLGGWNW